MTDNDCDLAYQLETLEMQQAAISDCVSVLEQHVDMLARGQDGDGIALAKVVMIVLARAAENIRTVRDNLKRADPEGDVSEREEVAAKHVSEPDWVKDCERRTQREADVRRLSEEGVAGPDIAKQLGITLKLVTKTRSDLGLNRKDT